MDGGSGQCRWPCREALPQLGEECRLFQAETRHRDIPALADGNAPVGADVARLRLQPVVAIGPAREPKFDPALANLTYF